MLATARMEQGYLESADELLEEEAEYSEYKLVLSTIQRKNASLELLPEFQGVLRGFKFLPDHPQEALRILSEAPRDSMQARTWVRLLTLALVKHGIKIPSYFDDL